MSGLRCFLVAALMTAMLGGTAEASLKLCNRTSYIVYAATAVLARGEIVTNGWTRVASGDCQTLLSDDLSAEAYYLAAKSSLAHSGAARAWGGASSFCVKNANFSLRTPSSATGCTADSAFTLPFAALDTHHLRSWTTTLTERPSLASLDAARLAGLKRLLHDNRLKAGALDGSADKEAAGSLIAFRKRMRMTDKASAADLFNALETEASKIAAPQGYAVCNDTAAPFWVALGQQKAKGWVSRGWWKVTARVCAQLTSDALTVDKIYLLAQRQGGVPLVGGAARFCVADIEFDIQGREHCAKRGLAEAGFAETSTRGAGGYVAHVGDGGFVSAPGPHPGLHMETSK